MIKGVPSFLRGPLRAAWVVGLEEAKAGRREEDGQKRERAWKLFLLLPRMLLHRRPGECFVSKDELLGRFDKFRAGNWLGLLEEAKVAAQPGRPRRKCTQLQSNDRRAERAEVLVGLGEVPSARQALEAAELAPGTEATRATLMNEERRPRTSRDPLTDGVQSFQPRRSFRLEKKLFSRNLGSAKKGAAAGPSGTTSEHFKVLLEDDKRVDLLRSLGEELAQATLPQVTIDAIRLGRLAALKNPMVGSEALWLVTCSAAS